MLCQWIEIVDFNALYMGFSSRPLTLHVHLQAKCPMTALLCELHKTKLYLTQSVQSMEPLVGFGWPAVMRIYFRVSWAALQTLYSNCTREITTEHNDSVDSWSLKQTPDFGWLSQVQKLLVIRTGFTHKQNVCWWSYEIGNTLWRSHSGTYIQPETLCFLRIFVIEWLARLG